MLIIMDSDNNSLAGRYVTKIIIVMNKHYYIIDDNLHEINIGWKFLPCDSTILCRYYDDSFPDKYCVFMGVCNVQIAKSIHVFIKEVPYVTYDDTVIHIIDDDINFNHVLDFCRMNSPINPQFLPNICENTYSICRTNFAITMFVEKIGG